MRRLMCFLQCLPKDAEIVRLDQFLLGFRRFGLLRRHLRGCGCSLDGHVEKAQVPEKRLHSALVWS